jgi:hypothetical protein
LNFPEQFYTEQNPNYAHYKQIEERIYQNRNKIVHLQQLLQPFGGSMVRPTDIEMMGSPGYRSAGGGYGLYGG